MNRTRWQIVIVAVALIAIAILLLGQQPQPVTVDPEDPEAPQPVTGGSYVEALIGEPGRLNPLLDYLNPVDRQIDRLIFDRLIEFDARGLPQGALVESWGISADGTVYNFALREEAVWHDGTPFSSDDVIFTIELLRDGAFPIPADVRELWQTVDVQRLDEVTLQMRLPEPFSPFMDYLDFGVLPAHLLGELSADEIVNGDFNLMPVGTGPYQIEGWAGVDGTVNGISLRAFDDYYRGRAFIDQIGFRFYADEEAALAGLQTGEVQGMGYVPQDLLPDVLALDGQSVYSARQPQLTMLLFNLGEAALPFLQDATLRRSLWMGLDRQGMLDQVLTGQGVIADGVILPGSWAYNERQPQIEYAPEEALRMLREAGYTIPASGGQVREKDGVRLSFTLLHSDTAVFTALAESIQAQWADLGVDAELEALPIEELLMRLEERDYDAALVELDFSATPDPDPYPFWHQAQSPNGQNYSQWDDRQASEMLEQARVINDVDERARLYRNFQVRFSQEAPAIPLFFPVYTFAMSDQVQGVAVGPLYEPSDRLINAHLWFLNTGIAGQ